LKKYMPKAKVKQYKCLIDLFIVEANPSLEQDCIDFYYSGGPSLEQNPKWNGIMRMKLLERALVLLEITKESIAYNRWNAVLRKFDLKITGNCIGIKLDRFLLTKSSSCAIY